MNMHSINGVKGELFGAVAAPAAPGTFSKQSWKSEARNVPGYGVGAKLAVKIRFDDQCKNGKNSFSITGEVVSRFGKLLAGGCVHDTIAEVFPELAPLIKWHLADPSGPMHYLSNALHHATNRDLAAARECAVWPEATDEQLVAPDLKEQLEARLPLLVAEFKAAVLAAGLAWEAPQVG